MEKLAFTGFESRSESRKTMRPNTFGFTTMQASVGRGQTVPIQLNKVAVRVLPTKHNPLLMPEGSRTLSLKGWFTWRVLQYFMLCVGMVTVALLLIRPDLGIPLMWNVLIPAAPALVTIAPGLWRNICPMATMHQLPKHLGISQYRKMPEWMAAGFGLIGVIGLFILVPFRQLGMDTTGPMTAVMLILAAATAWTMGALFEARCGWCNTLCPIHPVEKLYGTVPAMTFKNARCDLCENCISPCPDSTPAMTPTNIGSTKLQQFLGRFVVGSFPGFVWGWYQVPDYPWDQVGIHEVLTAYGWPYVAALVSYVIFQRTERALSRHESARQTLHRVFAAAAVSTYYWYSLPGVASSLGSLPYWFPLVSHMVTTSFFFWFLVFRSPKGASWLIRPTMASAYWSSLFTKTPQKFLIYAGPPKKGVT